MQSGPGGLWFAELDAPAGELRYQVVGHVLGHSTNGTRADAFEPDDAGDYTSVLRTTGGKVRIELDPAAFAPPGRSPDVVFADRDSPTARVAALALRRDALDHEAIVTLITTMLADKTPDPNARPTGWPAFQAELAALADSDAPTPVRRAALALWFSFKPLAQTPESAALARRALTELGATDPLWTLDPDALPNAIAATGATQEFVALSDAAIDGHPDPELAASLLLARLGEVAETGDEMAIRREYTRMQAPRFAGTGPRDLAGQYDPDRPLRAGRPMPALDLELLDPPAGAPTKLDLAALRGHPVLIDIWATWCTPCIAAMPELHRLHKLRPQGLEIVSIATDFDVEAVRAFRREKHKMPWRNVVVPEATSPDFHKRLGIVGIPLAVLLDEQGTIIASSPDLEVAQIPALLAKRAPAP
ncbi:MAG TPA: TlpA disulfide reductase family protein [Nannocystis sp.]